jgi:UDP-3-O-[3-hydroxymyristoyl] N-acetylglucosamine deacetylase/3-hydroxyacyl-[acyl-carrier-protein] dehydratase
MEYQSTIQQEVSIKGKGLHSGKTVTLTLKPAPENHGIIFQRVDLPDKPVIEARVNKVCETSYSTTIGNGTVVVKTVEHLMAALSAFSIDNLLIEIDAEETPILDGSAKLYVELLQKAEIKKQKAEREYIIIENEIQFLEQESGVSITAYPCDHFEVEVYVDYGTEVLSKQSARITDLQQFYPEIYDARTFVFLHELQFLISHNLVKGGDLDNAIVFVSQKPEQKVLKQLATFFNKQDIDITENGTLNLNPLKYPNEPAKHKLLDLIGDLYLLGKPIKGRIVAIKPGHFANTEFGKKIFFTSCSNKY